MEHDDLQDMVRAVRQFVRSEVVPEETTIDESDDRSLAESTATATGVRIDRLAVPPNAVIIMPLASTSRTR